MGDVDAVCAMLHNNASSLVNEPGTMRTLLTPLHVACEHGNTALIEVKYPHLYCGLVGRGFLC